MKTAIIVLADPAGGEEALGRLFNALAAAYDLKQKQQEVAILFQGAGTRWAGELTNPEHPVHALYAAVADRVAGVSSGCRANCCSMHRASPRAAAACRLLLIKR